MIKSKTKPKHFVAWVCHPCGVTYGKWYHGGEYTGPKTHYSTMHLGSCDVCGTNNVSVTEPRDYGHLLLDDV